MAETTTPVTLENWIDLLRDEPKALMSECASYGLAFMTMFARTSNTPEGNEMASRVTTASAEFNRLADVGRALRTTILDNPDLLTIEQYQSDVKTLRERLAALKVKYQNYEAAVAQEIENDRESFDAETASASDAYDAVLNSYTTRNKNREELNFVRLAGLTL